MRLIKPALLTRAKKRETNEDSKNQKAPPSGLNPERACKFLRGSCRNQLPVTTEGSLRMMVLLRDKSEQILHNGYQSILASWHSSSRRATSFRRVQGFAMQSPPTTTDAFYHQSAIRSSPGRHDSVALFALQISFPTDYMSTTST